MKFVYIFESWLHLQLGRTRAQLGYELQGLQGVFFLCFMRSLEVFLMVNHLSDSGDSGAIASMSI